MCKVWILEFGILDFGDFGFWILDFGDFGFWILGILDFGFWTGDFGWAPCDKILDANKKRRLCAPNRVGGYYICMIYIYYMIYDIISLSIFNSFVWIFIFHLL